GRRDRGTTEGTEPGHARARGCDRIALRHRAHARALRRDSSVCEPILRVVCAEVVGVTSSPSVRYSAIVARVTVRIAGLLVAGALALVPSRGDCAAGVQMGPWLMEPRRDAITLMLQRTAPGNLHVRVWPLDAPESSRDFVDNQSVALHEMRLSD